MDYNNSYEWLVNELEHIEDSNEKLERCGIIWIPIASLRRCGSILAIYESRIGFCAHAGDEWDILQEPLFGYFPKDFKYNDILIELSKRYDNIRNTNTLCH